MRGNIKRGFLLTVEFMVPTALFCISAQKTVNLKSPDGKISTEISVGEASLGTTTNRVLFAGNTKKIPNSILFLDIPWGIFSIQSFALNGVLCIHTVYYANLII